MGAGVRFRSVADMPKGVQAAAAAALASQAKSAPFPHPIPAPTQVEPRRHKYGARAIVIDGIRFDSTREGRLYESLKARQLAGEVAFFLRQVPIHLQGGTKLVIDFLVFFTDGSQPEFLDAKGVETPTFKVKRREVEAAYPIRIITV